MSTKKIPKAVRLGYTNYHHMLKGRKSLRRKHIVHQNGICAYCGVKMNHNVAGLRPTLEHIIPQFYGGKDIELHTIAVCADCNYERDNLPLRWHMILGIFIFKGIDGFYPISMNLWIWLKLWLSLKTRHIRVASSLYFG